MRRLVRTIVAVVAATGCATRVPARDVPPLTIAFAAPVDSTRALLLAALRQEQLPVDGGDATPRILTSTYVVRRGGLGEGTVRLRFSVDPDNRNTSLVRIEAAVTDKVRPVVFGADRRAPARPPTRDVGDNDIEALKPLQRVLRRLEAAGGLIARTP